MTDIVRNIVREELSKALEHFNPAISDIEDDIIHNFEAGRSFGINNLSKSIKGLDNYHMSDYFPKSEMKEGWIFEVDNHYGGAQLIEIIHELGGDHYGSYWSMKIAEVPRGSNVPEIKKETGKIQGYKNFIEIVNSHFEKDVNPQLL